MPAVAKQAIFRESGFSPQSYAFFHPPIYALTFRGSPVVRLRPLQPLLRPERLPRLRSGRLDRGGVAGTPTLPPPKPTAPFLNQSTHPYQSHHGIFPTSVLHCPQTSPRRQSQTDTSGRCYGLDPFRSGFCGYNPPPPPPPCPCTPKAGPFVSHLTPPRPAPSPRPSGRRTSRRRSTVP